MIDLTICVSEKCYLIDCGQVSITGQVSIIPVRRPRREGVGAEESNFREKDCTVRLKAIEIKITALAKDGEAEGGMTF